MSARTPDTDNATTPRVVFLLDIDNTLLDNDQVTADLKSYMLREFGARSSASYWNTFEELRRELGYADYLGALQRHRLEVLDDTRLLEMSFYLLDYPFQHLVYPEVFSVLRALSTHGPTVILSDGDVVFQPHKVRRAGIWDAVDGRVLIYIHKEVMLHAVAREYPAQHYVMIDDKLRILSAMKEQWKERLTTVFVRQGHYASDPDILRAYPPADLAIDHISELRANAVMQRLMPPRAMPTPTEPS